MHLTNYSINKMSEDYAKLEATSDVLTDTQGTKRTLSALYKSLAASGVDVDKIKTNISDTCGKIMQIYGPMIEHQLSAVTNCKPNVNSKLFQILGFDLLIDRDLNVWVLEVNDHPSLNIYHDTEAMGSIKRMDDSDICPVDLHVKSSLIIDSVSLAKKSFKTVKDTDDFGCLSRVHPKGSD